MFPAEGARIPAVNICFTISSGILRSLSKRRIEVLSIIVFSRVGFPMDILSKATSEHLKNKGSPSLVNASASVAQLGRAAAS
jgi:hypothetical protein